MISVVDRYGVGWEEIGCNDYPNKETSGGKMRCTCATDLCNAPVSLDSLGMGATSNGQPRSRALHQRGIVIGIMLQLWTQWVMFEFRAFSLTFYPHRANN